MGGLNIVAVNNLSDPFALLNWASQYKDGPVLFIENKLLYNDEQGQAPQGYNLYFIKDLNSTQIAEMSPNEAADILIIGYGGVSTFLLETIEQLKTEEINASMLVPEQISPVAKRLSKL